jgi:excisionase family DNA binding protein
VAESVRPKLDGNEQTIDPNEDAGHTRANHINTRASFEPLLTATDAAQLLNLHPVTLLCWSREGRVPHLRLGRRVMFRASELDAWCRAGYTSSAVRAA